MKELAFLIISKEMVGKNTQSLSLKANPFKKGDTITIESFGTDVYPTGNKDTAGNIINREMDYFLVRSADKGDAIVKLSVAEALKISGASVKDPSTGIVKFVQKFSIESATPRVLPSDGKTIMYPLSLSVFFTPGMTDFSAASVAKLRSGITEKDETKAIQTYTAVAVTA